MGESKFSEKLNLELNNIFIDKSDPEVGNNKMNESISSTASLLEESLLKPAYDAKVKEENLAFSPQDRSLSPIFPQSKPLKQEFEDYPEKFLNNEEIPPESDEETIATFITAAGQQLALYAVEDSEEIFAVAVYDESGLPPTDFQFLMKSDVEKLIGEGAIRTVKKPSQLKNQVYAVDHSFTSTGDPPPSPPPLIETPQKSVNPPSLTPLIKQENLENSKNFENFENSQKIENFENSREFENFENVKKFENFKKERKIENFENSENLREFENFENTQKIQISSKNLNSPEFTQSESQIPPQFIYENWTDNVILLIQNDTSLETKDTDLPETKSFNEIDNELMERSTVQYILSDDPPDSSDLTLDDIEHLLGEKSHHPPSPPSPEDQPEPPAALPAPVEGSLTPSTSPINEINVKIEKISTEKYFPHDFNEKDEKNEENNAKESNSPESVDLLRIKRPRKQQLTMVNRADSEIIIQQTTIAPIDENSENSDYDKRKKRGRRRKKKEIRPKNRPYMRTRGRSASNPKNRKKYRIEVIDLDIDDGEIINLEEIKEKGSSDKENEIIMVGDSDDDDNDDEEGGEEDEVEVDDSDDSDYEGGEVRRSRRRRSSPRKLEIFECKNCRKKFRKKEEFVRHGKLCKKVEERIRRGPMRSVRLCKEGREEGRGKKDYECKVCHERFEVVVALARHVRLMHSLRKRGEEEEEGRGKKGERRKRGAVVVKEKRAESSKRRERQEKIRRNSVKNPSTRKINCRECGRWFQGLGLLLAHSLQHATKKIVSEKSRVRRCQLCKKIFKSRFLFICHMRMHSNIVPLRRNHMRTIKQTEKSKKKLKKRGKPQKL